MTKKEANLQSLSLGAAFLIAFIGTVHEVVGPTLFPWAPVSFGSMIWHTMGVLVILVGLLCMGGVLRVIEFPVVPCGILMGFVGIAVVIFVAYMRQEFHYFAVWISIAGFSLAIAHSKALRLQKAARMKT